MSDETKPKPRAPRKPRKPKRKSRPGNYGVTKPRKLNRALLCVALRSCPGNLTAAAHLMTKWNVEASDAAREAAEQENPGLPPESEAKRAARHAACAVRRQTVSDYCRDFPEVEQARKDGFNGMIGKARDGLAVHIERGNLVAIRYLLDRCDPEFAPRSKVTLETPVGEPLDAGDLTEEQRAEVMRQTGGEGER